jgi:[ribosomal protein S5]-alanine N-acetyltransferase
VRMVHDRLSGDFLGWVFMRLATASRDAAALGWTRADEVEVGYRYRRAAWGRGVATEAAMPLVQIALADAATSAVVACVMASNTGSLRVLEKLGLERVGAVMFPEANEPAIKLARVSVANR